MRRAASAGSRSRQVRSYPLYAPPPSSAAARQHPALLWCRSRDIPCRHRQAASTRRHTCPCVRFGCRGHRGRPLRPSSQSSPNQRMARRITCVFLGGAGGVGVLDAQDERSALCAGKRPVVDCRSCAADMQATGRRGCESYAHAVCMFRHVSPSLCVQKRFASSAFQMSMQ